MQIIIKQRKPCDLQEQWFSSTHIDTYLATCCGHQCIQSWTCADHTCRTLERLAVHAAWWKFKMEWGSKVLQRVYNQCTNCEKQFNWLRDNLLDLKMQLVFSVHAGKRPLRMAQVEWLQITEMLDAPTAASHPCLETSLTNDHGIIFYKSISFIWAINEVSTTTFIMVGIFLVCTQKHVLGTRLNAL